MSICRLTDEHAERYERFRRRMWPQYDPCGEWESVRRKYVLHPHADSCPGSGLYGFLFQDELVAIHGAYPFPVTFQGVAHPGHLLVDWAVLPEHQHLPIGGVLFRNSLNLPGRKFASSGNELSQGPIAKLGRKIDISFAWGIISPVAAGCVKLLRLAQFLQPSLLCATEGRVARNAWAIAPGDLPTMMPAETEHVAYVKRDRDYWLAWADNQAMNGAFALRLRHPAGEGTVSMQLLEAGRFRVAHLQTVWLEPYTVECARALGHTLRTACRQLAICALTATESDAQVRAFVRAASLLVRRSTTHWWALPRPDDAFDSTDARWWLTSADRDGQWGFARPGLVAENTARRNVTKAA